MKSVKCSTCGFVAWGGEVCKKCGAPVTPRPATSPVQSNNPLNNQPNGRTRDLQLKKGLAIGCLVIGILNIFTLSSFLIGAALGTTLAIVTLIKINNNPSEYGGKGLAIAGLVMSVASVVIIVPLAIIAAIVIPNLLASGATANEASTIRTLRGLSAAEGSYASMTGTYGTLEELGAAQLIGRGLTAGTLNGYRIKIDVSKRDSMNEMGFKLVAVPLRYPYSGRTSFYLDETGVIRGADARGGPASELDGPLNLDVGSSSRAPVNGRHDPDFETFDSAGSSPNLRGSPQTRFELTRLEHFGFQFMKVSRQVLPLVVTIQAVRL